MGRRMVVSSWIYGGSLPRADPCLPACINLLLSQYFLSQPRYFFLPGLLPDILMCALEEGFKNLALPADFHFFLPVLLDLALADGAVDEPA